MIKTLEQKLSLKIFSAFGRLVYQFQARLAGISFSIFKHATGNRDRGKSELVISWGYRGDHELVTQLQEEPQNVFNRVIWLCLNLTFCDSELLLSVFCSSIHNNIDCNFEECYVGYNCITNKETYVYWFGLKLDFYGLHSWYAHQLYNQHKYCLIHIFNKSMIDTNHIQNYLNRLPQSLVILKFICLLFCNNQSCKKSMISSVTLYIWLVNFF